MHGGLLRIEEWEARYQAVSAELEQVEMKEIERPAVEKNGDSQEDESDVEGTDEDGPEGDEGDGAEDDETVTGSPSKTPARTPRARWLLFAYDFHNVD